MKAKTYFGNGVWVADDGALFIEFRHPGGVGVQVAKSFKESLEEAIAFSERFSNYASLGIPPQARKQAPN